MFKRVTWFAAGTIAGASGSVYARRRLREAAQRYRPVAVVRTTAGGIKRRAGDVSAAVHEGRAAMRERELQLRAATGDPVDSEALAVGVPSAPARLSPGTGGPWPPDVVDRTGPADHAAAGRPGPRRRARR